MSHQEPFAGAELVAVLPSADLDRAEIFYGRLGFRAIATYPGYLILAAGEMHLHLRHHAETDPTGSEAGVYLYLASPDALRQVHDGWEAAGARIISPPADQPYGLLEFATEDLDGNLWRVGAPTSTDHTAATAPDAGHDRHAGSVAGDPGGEAGPDVAAASGADAIDAGQAEPDDAIEPDWFAVVASGTCERCGYSAVDVPTGSVGARIRDEAYQWTTLLRPADDDLVRRRPTQAVWSALEYGAHVRDVLAVFRDRVHLMLAETEPDLGWWDHEAAMEDGFANETDRESVADDLMINADRLAEVLADVVGDQWQRGGTRRSGERFTIELLVRFALHETVHHRADAARSMTVEPEDQP